MLKFAAGLMAALWAAQAFAAPSLQLYPTFKAAYGRGSFSTISIPGATFVSTAGIDSAGTVAGTCWRPKRISCGFVRHVNGNARTFSAGDAGRKQGAFVTGINASGDIIGTYIDPDNVSHGFLRQANGTFPIFDPPGSIRTIVTGINGSDTVVGYYLELPYRNRRGFIRTADGTFTTFHVPGDEEKSFLVITPTAINDAGIITGYYDSKPNGHQQSSGFVYTPGGTITTFDPQDSPIVQPVAINSVGTIAGTMVNRKFVSVGFLRTADGAVSTFRIGSAKLGTFVQDFDDAGDIVGHYITSDGTTHGFERTAKGKNKTIDAAAAGTGNGNGTYLTGINVKGMIAGFYLNTNTNARAGFVWIP